MPSLGASMEAGTLVEWLKRRGDTVHRGDIIAVVDTEKGAIEIEVFEDGVVEDIRVQPGERVPVGTVLAFIRGAENATAPGPQPQPPLLTAAPSPAAAEPVEMAAVPPSAPAAKPAPRASPAARALARELGLDLAGIPGTGPGGAIGRADVERAAPAAAPPAPAAGAPDAADRMRRAIAAAMTRSKREIPHFYLGTTIDMSRALAWMAGENAVRTVEKRLLPAALLIKAVALALRDVPEVNGFWTGGGFKPGGGVHPGIAVSLRSGGLVAPALHDADARDLSALMAALRDLVARARAGGLRSSELADPTATITNLGEQGVEVGYGIIHPPQVALVSFGRIGERPVAVSGRVEVRSVVVATVSADHRAVDGHRAGLFLAAVDRRLQEPERL
jgi:pyruvate dehydrogenase E2 component (dihydrolipoamide acetyltransferase)